MHSILDFLIEEDIPWVSTGGSYHPNVDRDTMVQIDSDYGRDLSWTGYRWNDKHLDEEVKKEIGPFTARVPVLDKEGSEVLSVFVMDSMSWADCGIGAPGTSCISAEAVSWFAE